MGIDVTNDHVDVLERTADPNPVRSWREDGRQRCLRAACADLAEETDALTIILGRPRGGMLSFIETLAGRSVSHQLSRQHGRPVLMVPESQAQDTDPQ